MISKWKMMLFLMMTVMATSAHAIIVEVSQFESILHYAAADVLVILDIDDTLLDPVQELGNDRWFQHRMRALREEGVPKDEALQTALTEWEGLRYWTDVRAVEEVTPEIVAKLQDNDIPVMGLTTQGHQMSRITLRQLAKCGFNLTRTAPVEGAAAFVTERPIVYDGGVLFTDGTNKGVALNRLFQERNYRPNRIVFVNDKKQNLKGVEQMCKEEGIGFVGLRYGYLDEKVRNFDSAIAEAQWERFGGFLSDSEARALLKSVGNVCSTVSGP